MKKYMAIYTGTQEDMTKWMQLSETERKDREKRGMEAWKQWGIKNQTSIVTTGGPLGKTLKIDRNGISPFRNQLAAWVVVQAESQEAAAKMFLEHPHFSIFPGHAVEVMECLPLPEMK